MAIKVHGGIITDQMLKGIFTYYEIVGPFEYTVSGQGVLPQGDVIIPGAEVEGGNPDTTIEFFVGPGKPVPGSAADITLRLILEKCTISQIKLVDTGTDGTGAAATTTIQIAVENSSNGWNTTTEGPFDPVTGLDTNSDAAANMQAAIQALPGATVPDITNTGAAVVFTAITVTEKEFLLV